ncbi:NupC/NupG family nucleoside CNT transporter [Endozoicomonas sp. SM1973]|uniref:Nucleoside permease n=1 Tax=Spartinivicinus marinus TaxID=2994442 RepID=A0A853HW10_9GAMM|nr:NupC/NupG family nucleoside CNT transporter [Spartinivicinus marinus]MCX4028974.1 NupC/NupG family nucleoside CNT transporter [Spartinivicinus marinus]NYZ65443.1 NupC/NupG family nucleoside CNT transporter [Spartinivicinus marinus]
MILQIIISLGGMLVLLGIALALSSNRKAINVRTIGGAFALQLLIGAFVLYTSIGQDVLNAMASGVNAVITQSKVGTEFLFGDLAKFKVGFVFAINVLTVIIFFSSLIAVLYYLGIMQLVIRFIGGGIQKLLGTSRPESLSATANIFVGQTEAPLVVKPFIPTMTQSELFAIMVGGLASVAGTVLAGYAGLGADMKFLIAASFMAAPGGLLMAKIIMPETEEPHQNFDEVLDDADKPANVIDAAAVGASNGLRLAVNVGAMLIAFVGLIALLNFWLGGIGEYFGVQGLTFQGLLGWFFSPIAFVLGVPWSEAHQVGSLIGQKLILNEFVAYMDFANIKDSLSPTSQAIATFALCGFANLSSIAILLGGLGSLAPSRRHDIARMGIKAVIAGTLSNLMSATIAGIFLTLATL